MSAYGRICQPLCPESSGILLGRQKNEDLKIEDGRYVSDIYSNILEILYLDSLLKFT